MTSEIAHAVDSTARVAYVDRDPVVLLHAEGLLDDDDSGRVTDASGG
ncbi:SAM-dependent methyltransferase [Kribbella sp. NPDC050820]